MPGGVNQPQNNNNNPFFVHHESQTRALLKWKIARFDRETGSVAREAINIQQETRTGNKANEIVEAEWNSVLFFSRREREKAFGDGSSSTVDELLRDI